MWRRALFGKDDNRDKEERAVTPSDDYEKKLEMFQRIMSNKTCPVKAESFVTRCLRVKIENREGMEHLGALTFRCRRDGVLVTVRKERGDSNHAEIAELFRRLDYQVITKNNSLDSPLSHEPWRYEISEKKP